MKNAFIIGGLNIHHTPVDEHYSELREAVASKDYNVLPADISWRRTIPTQFAERFKEFYRANKSPEGNVVIGNSFGAVVALITAAELQPDLLMLCSLSPFFKEDWTDFWPESQHLRRLGKRRVEDIKQYSLYDIAATLSEQDIAIKILYGELEKDALPVLVERSRSLARMITAAELIEVPGAPHRFRMPEYVAGIANAL